MSSIDPYIISIPKELLDLGPGAQEYFENDNFWKSQVFAALDGGDSIDDLEVLSQIGSINSKITAQNDRINNLESELQIKNAIIADLSDRLSTLEAQIMLVQNNSLIDRINDIEAIAYVNN